RPVDIDAFALYDGHEATLDARVLDRNTSLVDLAARVRVAASDVFRWRGGAPPPWRGELSANLRELPLSQLPFFGDAAIGGHVTASVRIDGLNERPVVAIDLRFPDLAVGEDAFFEDGALSLYVTPREAGASDALATAYLRAQDGGSFSARAQAGVRWRPNAAP